jgi:hypothetical protein
VLMPVHAVGLVAMGLWLLDNCDLEACAATAAELGLPPLEPSANAAQRISDSAWLNPADRARSTRHSSASTASTSCSGPATRSCGPSERGLFLATSGDTHLAVDSPTGK